MTAQAAPRRALAIINTGSRRGTEDGAAALRTLADGGIELMTAEPDSPTGVGAAIRAQAGLVDLVVLGGGDGTIPAHDLARVLGIPADPVAAARIVLDGRRNRIDLGRANDHLFFNIATIGLSARLARAMDRQTKKRFGAFAYALTAARVGLGPPFRARIRAGEQWLDLDAIQVAVGNGRYHGGGIVVHEAAAIDDRLLHLYVLEPTSLPRLLGKLPWLLQGKHRAMGVQTLAATDIHLDTGRRLPVNTDGELTTWTPVQFSVIPEAVEVCVPA